jgi:hypothetical protein
MEGYTDDGGQSLAERGKTKGKRGKIKKKTERKRERKREMKTKKRLIFDFFHRGLLFE